AQRHAQRPGCEQREPLVRCSVKLGSATSLNNLVRTLQYRLWDREAKCLGRLEVDHELEFRRLLDREVGWPRTLEDLIHVNPGAPPLIRQAWPVRHQASGLHILPGTICGRQAAPCCEVCEPCAMENEQRVRHDEEGPGALFRHRRECAVELVRTAGLQE